MIPSGYSRNVFQGTLAGGEIFQTSFWCNEAPSDQAATQAQADAIASKWNADKGVSGNPLGMISSGSSYDSITTYSYLDNTGKATFVGHTVLATSTGVTAQNLPDQCCLVATLLTGNAGRRNRGRMYFPLQVATLTSGQVSSTLTSGFATWLSSFFTHVNSTLGTQHIVVLSQIGGTSHTVNAVQVDSKIDIQRRRADKVIPITKSLVAVT
jgi:hypothetical protein